MGHTQKKTRLQTADERRKQLKLKMTRGDKKQRKLEEQSKNRAEYMQWYYKTHN